MKKRLKIVLIVVAVLVGAFAAVALTYRVVNAQGIADSFAVNDPSSEQRVHIVTQGRRFKDEIVAAVTGELETQGAYVLVEDITRANGDDAENWDAVLVLTAIQSGRLVDPARAYFRTVTDLSNHVILVTSGSGAFKPESVAVDVISTPSRMEATAEMSHVILERLGEIMVE